MSKKFWEVQNAIHLLMTYQTVSWSTSVALSSRWIGRLGEAAVCETSPSCHTLADQWCKSKAGTADGSLSHLCGINAGENWPTGGHTRSWKTLSAVWTGSSCMGHSEVYWKTPRASRGSWCRARTGEELPKTAGEEEDKINTMQRRDKIRQILIY